MKKKDKITEQEQNLSREEIESMKKDHIERSGKNLSYAGRTLIGGVILTTSLGLSLDSLNHSKTKEDFEQSAEFKKPAIIRQVDNLKEIRGEISEDLKKLKNRKPIYSQGEYSKVFEGVESDKVTNLEKSVSAIKNDLKDLENRELYGPSLKNYTKATEARRD